MKYTTFLGSTLAIGAAIVVMAPDAYALPVTVSVPSSTFIGNTCIWGNSATPVPTPGILGRVGDRIIRNFGAESAAPGGVVLTCNSRFSLTTQLLAAPGVSTTFKNQAGTVCGSRVAGGSVNLLNTSCTAAVSANFDATSALMGFTVEIIGAPAPAPPAPAGNYTYTLRATAAPN